MKIKNKLISTVGPIAEILWHLAGPNIRRRRKDLGLSQTDLFRNAGLGFQTKQHLSQIENGDCGIRMTSLYLLCGALNCQITDILPSVDELLSATGLKREVRTTVVTVITGMDNVPNELKDDKT